MADHTDRTTVLALAIKNKLLATELFQDVLYGRHEQIPRSPTAVVTPAPKRRDLAGVSAPGGRTMNFMTIFIDIHSMKVGDEETERLALDQLAESAEAALHADVTMGGIIIHGFVHEWNPGETHNQGGEFRTVRLTYIGETKTYLSS